MENILEDKPKRIEIDLASGIAKVTYFNQDTIQSSTDVLDIDSIILKIEENAKSDI